MLAETLQSPVAETRSPYDRANSLFDRIVRPDVGFLGRRYSAFLACGMGGLISSVALGLALTWYQGLSFQFILILSATSVAALLVQTMVMKILTGEETLVYYRHEVAIIATAALTLWWLQQPVWPYLDITILAVGIFLVCGRVGCLMVGCCHGRPHQCGARYQSAHATVGFTRYYVGIRLFPIQIVESAWVLVTVVVGVTMILRGRAPGEAFAWYVIVYDVGRFAFEFVRGDPDRPYLAGFSEAQWTSVVLMVVILIGEASGTLPFHTWHWAATAGVIIAMLVVLRHRARSGLARSQLLHPRHVREIATALDRTDVPKDQSQDIVLVARTSLGVQLSTAATPAEHGPVRHYTISLSGAEISEDAARTVADLVLVLQRVSAPAHLTRGSVGVFHLVVEPAGSAS